MRRLLFWSLGVVGGLACLWLSASIGSAEPDASGKSADGGRVSVEVARDRAKVMHDVYAATLDVIHERYFHGDRAMVPARALEDVFEQIRGRSKVEARWISVSFKPMGLNHEPKSDFEKKAAEDLAKGKPEIEVVEDGYYRRAGAILFTEGCISCHAGFFKTPSKTPKFAGLVISVPVLLKSK